MLTSICRSQREALLTLGQLHNGGRMIEADFTWGRGSFWTGSSEIPRIRTDRCPDLIVLQARTVMVGWNHHVQRHARKVHSYFWAFRKGKTPR